MRTYQYRLYPNKPQVRALNSLMWHSKRLYNIARRDRIYRYEVNGESLHWKAQTKIWVTQARKVDEGLALLPYDTATYILLRLHKSYANFFRRIKAGDKKAGFPHKMRFCETLEYKYPSGIKLDAVKVNSKTKVIEDIQTEPGWTTLYLMNVGEIRCRYHRALPEIGRISYASVTYNQRTDQWHVQIIVDSPQLSAKETQNRQVGIDIGIAKAFTLSDGTFYHPPKYYEETLHELRIIGRKLDRQRRINNPDCYDEKKKPIKGKRPINQSNRMRKTLAELRRLHAKVAGQRREWLHEVTTEIVQNHNFVVIEDLSPQFMIKNKHLALKALDISFTKFKELLTYKVASRQGQLIKVNPAYTSQTCHRCGNVDQENRQTQAIFHCTACGHQANADVNAARNILDKGIKLASTSG